MQEDLLIVAVCHRGGRHTEGSGLLQRAGKCT